MTTRRAEPCARWCIRACGGIFSGGGGFAGSIGCVTRHFGSGVSGTSGLTVNTAGQTAFAGAVNLGSLITDAGGTTQLGGNVTTSGAQAYGDGLELTGDVTLASTLGESISINAGANGGHALAVNTAGTTTLAGGFGSTTALASLATGTGGTTSSILGTSVHISASTAAGGGWIFQFTPSANPPIRNK